MANKATIADLICLTYEAGYNWYAKKESFDRSRKYFFYECIDLEFLEDLIDEEGEVYLGDILSSLTIRTESREIEADSDTPRDSSVFYYFSDHSFIKVMNGNIWDNKDIK